MKLLNQHLKQMKTKEEVIKEAWIEILGTKQYEIDETNIWPDGWFRRDLAFGIITDDELKQKGDFDEMKKYGFWHIRPKSISGIENNNLWIRIESEADLPSDEKAEYYFYDINVKDRMKSLNIDLKPVSFTALKQLFVMGFCTHYAPIEKRQPPIF